MSNSGMHFIIGAVASLLTYAVLKQQRNEQLTWEEAIPVALIGGTVGVLPDIIDPPKGPNHRSIGHSVAGGTGLSILGIGINENPNIQQPYKDFLTSMIASYLSHLALDAQTPAGLPFFENGGTK